MCVVAVKEEGPRHSLMLWEDRSTPLSGQMECVMTKRQNERRKKGRAVKGTNEGTVQIRCKRKVHMTCAHDRCSESVQ